ncbi:hypothetical protein H7K33_15275 [Mycobacterium paraense]|uniref:DUF6542 domain-containing protein n=1 Tax=Mycobacterium paraense TaxID=767916 RepID=UPI00157C4423|nr:DUF6542 domain-containing protein [Mycobacterium paraense]MCV7443598.1 hypothetical protein [Mycobacterium paraense]
MSEQRARSAVEASHRSIHPNIPGVPWWAALVLAITATAVGYAIDAGHKDLTHVFAGFYIAGCVAAVLAVRQDGVFTAIIQPPLILFCAVPGAYWMFHGRKIGNLKDLLINCGYPLIERFPLMLGTAGAVLLIGLVRWYFGKSQPAAAEAKDDDAAAAGTRSSFVGALGAKLNSLLGLGGAEEDEAPSDSKRARQTGRSPKAASRTGRTTRGDRPERATRAHSRRARPPVDDERDPRDARDERPRRRRPAPPRDFDPADPPPRPRRRPRPHDDPDIRQPRETRREPRTRRNPYERPYERPAPRGSRFDGYEPYEPYEPRRRRATPTGNGSNPTHHPISQVRYRDSGTSDEPGPERRRRAPRGFPTESWEYEG